MSRILLLLIIILWMSRTVAPPTADIPAPPWQGPALFLGGLALVVLLVGLWSRMIARTVRGFNLHRSLGRFNTFLLIARLMIPLWFGVGIFALGWGNLVDQLLMPLRHWPVELPGMLIGTSPAFLAWMGLWWAQFPADRALREQNLLIQINEDAPIHPPPELLSYFTAHLRLQLLFTVVPIALILLLHDLSATSFWLLGGVDLNKSAPTRWIAGLEFAVQGLSITLALLFVPEVLRRVLDTQPLPGSALRSRLEQLCAQTRLHYREILLWRTNFHMGNAAVMGLIPQSRYILLSDVLLERMDEQQIEAVFAHEVGHVKHWHMGWYVVLFATLAMFAFAAGEVFGNALESGPTQHWIDPALMDAIMTLCSVCGFLLVFGFLSRGFERQADVYAARTMQGVDSSMDPSEPLNSHVGPYGADVFISALRRVAVVNNIPLETHRPRRRGVMGTLTGVLDWVVDLANNYFHGSIASRMGYLRSLSADPRRTAQFDRRMKAVRMVLVAGFVLCATWSLLLPAHPAGSSRAALNEPARPRQIHLSRRSRSGPQQPAPVSPAAAAIPAVAGNAP